MKNSKNYNTALENLKDGLDSRLSMYLNEISMNTPLTTYQLGVCGGIRIAKTLLVEVACELHDIS